MAGGQQRGNQKRGGSNSIDWYALLNVKRDATREEIKAAYTRLARALHPDKYERTLAMARMGVKTDEEKAKFDELAELERAEAQELFILVDKAYKILSSDTERLIYDSFGMDGLSALYSLASDDKRKKKRDANKEELTIVCPDMSVVGFFDERGYHLKEKLLGRVQLERELDAIARYNLRGIVQIHVDAQGVLGNAFEPPSEYDIYDPGASTRLSFSPPAVTGVVIQQSVEAALSSKDVLTFGGHVISRGSVGTHNLSIGHEHKFSESTSSELTLGTTLRDPLSFSLKGNRTLSQYMKGSLEFVVRDHGKTGLNVQAARKLSDTVTGILQLGLGVESGVLVQLHHSDRFGQVKYMSKKEQEEYYYKNYYKSAKNDTAQYIPSSSSSFKQENQGNYKNEDTDWTRPDTSSNNNNNNSAHEEDDEQDDYGNSVDTFFTNGTAMLYLSKHGLGIQSSWARSFSPKSHGKIALKLGSSNVEVELSSVRVLSAHSKGDVTLSAGLSGVRLTVRYDRGGVRFSIPIALSSGLSFGAACIGGIIPSALNYCFFQLIRPFRERRQAKEKYETELKLIEARKKARLQQQIMAKTAEKKRAVALDNGGLVILVARYGCHLHHSCDWRDVDKPDMNAYIKREQGRPRLPSDWDDDDGFFSEGVQRQREIVEEEKSRFEEDISLLESEKGRTASSYTKHPANIEVTQQLNFFLDTDKNTLDLHGGKTKAALLGFYNPCLNRSAAVEPRLFIRYKLGSWVYEYTCDDLEPVHLPSPRAMLIGNTFTEPDADFGNR